MVETAIDVEIGNVKSVVGAPVNWSDAEVGSTAPVVWYWYWPESVDNPPLLPVVAPSGLDGAVMGRTLLVAEVIGRSVTVTTTGEADSLLVGAPYPDAWGDEKTGSAPLISVGEESGMLELGVDGPTV